MNHSSTIDERIAAPQFSAAVETQRQSLHVPQTRAYWATLLFIAGYMLATVACLWQWNSPRPWQRLDVFSVGFLWSAWCGDAR